MKLEPGILLMDRYKILSELGEGGFGVVYRAFDQHLNRDVAVKQLKLTASDSEGVERFMRESRVLSKLKHPSVLSVYAVEFPANSSPIMLLEFIDGVSLQQLIRERFPSGMPEHLVKILFKQICEGVSCAHEESLLHRDLSSSNVLISGEDKNLQAHIIDFGLSKLLNQAKGNPLETLTKTGSLIGNPAYMSPEACMGEQLDTQADIYSLACLLYELMTGKTPFQADEAIGILYKHLNEYPEEPALHWNNKTAEMFYKKLCLYGLQKNKNKRAKSAKEILLLIDQEDSSNIDAELDAGWTFKAPSGRKPKILGLVIVSLVSLVLTGVFFALIALKTRKSAHVPIKSEVQFADRGLIVLQEKLKKKIAFHGSPTDVIRVYDELEQYSYRHAKTDLMIEYGEKLKDLSRQYPRNAIFTSDRKLDMLVNLNTAYRRKGDLKKARQQVDEAMAILKHLNQPENSRANIFWSIQLAELESVDGSRAKAENLFLKCVKLSADSRTKSDHLDSLMGAAEFYGDDQPEKAGKFYKLANIEACKRFGEGSPYFEYDADAQSVLLLKLGEIAESCRRIKDYKQAEEIAVQVSEICKSRKYFSNREALELGVMENSVCSESDQGHYKKARQICNDARKILESRFAEDSSKLSFSQYRYLGWTYWTFADYQSAIDLLEKAHAIISKLEGANSEIARVCVDEIAISYLKNGNFAKAETLYKDLLAKGQPFPNERWRTINSKLCLATCYLNTGKQNEAKNLLQEAIAQAENYNPVLFVPFHRLALAQLCLKEQDILHSEKQFRKAASDAVGLNREDGILRVSLAAAEYFGKHKNQAEQERILLEALAKTGRCRPANSPARVQILESLLAFYLIKGNSELVAKYRKELLQEKLKSKDVEPWPARDIGVVLY